MESTPLFRYWELTFKRHLRPGYGFIQHIEIDYQPRCDDGTMSKDGWLSRWYGYLAQATEQANKPITYREDTREMLQRAGFTDITEQVIKAPLCSWNDDPLHFNIANYHQLCMDLCFGLEALSLALFSRLWNWDEASIRGLIDAARTEIRTKAVHEYNNMYVGNPPGRPKDSADNETDMYGLPGNQAAEAGPHNTQTLSLKTWPARRTMQVTVGFLAPALVSAFCVTEARTAVLYYDQQPQQFLHTVPPSSLPADQISVSPLASSTLPEASPSNDTISRIGRKTTGNF